MRKETMQQAQNEVGAGEKIDNTTDLEKESDA